MHTYFVSTEEHASDENDGTERKPFATYPEGRTK